MTSMELLTILNSIRDSYILEARNIGSPQKPKMPAPGGGNAGEKPLLFSSEKTPGRYQAKESRKRKKNGLKRFLVLSAAAGILLAALAGKGTIAGWADYFETFLNRTENQYQYTQPIDETKPHSESPQTEETLPISGDGESIPYTEEVPPAFSTEPVTFDGYALTPEGGSVPVRLTMEVENVEEGEAAWQQIVSQGAQLPEPEQGKEYILVTVKVTYEDGDLETLNFYENYPASWAAAVVYFNIPNENSNTEDVTRQLPNCIWGPDEYKGRTLSKGESITGDVAFLQDVGNTEPLYFVGYNQVIEFQIH